MTFTLSLQCETVYKSTVDKTRNLLCPQLLLEKNIGNSEGPESSWQHNDIQCALAIVPIFQFLFRIHAPMSQYRAVLKI